MASTAQTTGVAVCGKYDTQNKDSVALSPRCVDGDGVRRRGKPNASRSLTA